MLRWMAGSGRKTIEVRSPSKDSSCSSSSSTYSERDDEEPANEEEQEDVKEDWVTCVKRTTGMAEGELLAKARIDD